MRAQVPTNQDAVILKEFKDRVDKYAELHKRVEAKLPELKDRTDPAKISAHKEALARAIRAERSNAKPGDIFFPAVKPQLRRIIQNEFRGRDGATARATITVGNPTTEGSPTKVRLKVNAPYPGGAPLSTIPPTLLLNLPQLPEQVEYRFVGRHLILRDTTGDLIVDFILNAVAGN